jgi:hypothetical protein
MSQWVEEEEETVSDRLILVDNSIYDHIVVQSDTEKAFCRKAGKANRRAPVRQTAGMDNRDRAAF